MKKRDLYVIALAIVILVILSLAPKETTSFVPRDTTHQAMYTLAHDSGSRAAEKQCQNCHNPKGVPFPKGHPPKFRCLFCHRLQK